MSIQDQISSSQLSGGNAAFVEELYESYLLDPQSVSPSWQQYFSSLGGKSDVRHSEVLERIGALSKANVVLAAAPAAGADSEQAGKQAALLRLINSHRTRGHLRAKLDPLEMMAQPEVPDLALEFHGFSAADMAAEFEAPILVGTI